MLISRPPADLDEAQWDELAMQAKLNLEAGETSSTAVTLFFEHVAAFLKKYFGGRYRRPDVDDYVQNALLRLWRSGLASYQPDKGRFRWYVLTLARHAALVDLRSSRSWQLPGNQYAWATARPNDAREDWRGDPEWHHRQSEAGQFLQARIKAALGELPAEQLLALRSRMTGSAFKEIAAELKKTNRSVASALVTKAIAQLQDKLGHLRNVIDVSTAPLLLDLTSALRRSPPNSDPTPDPEPPRPFIEAVDPYVVGRAVSNELFVGRNDILKQVWRNLEPSAGNNILVLRGQRRTGKTSVLIRLRDTLARDSRGTFLPVFVDVQGMTSCQNEGQFLYELAYHLHTSLQEQGVQAALPPLERFLAAPSLIFKLEFLKAVSAGIGKRRVLLMLDEFEKMRQMLNAGRIGEEILDLLRHLMQHSPLLFLIAGTQQLRELTGQTWSVFFNLAVSIDIGALADSEARWLIREPVKAWYEVADSAADLLVRNTGGHPYFTQLVCKKIVEVRNEARVSVVTAEHVKVACRRALTTGEDQIGYPWTEDDCTPAERLVLSLLAQQPPGTASPVDRVRAHLEDFRSQLAGLPQRGADMVSEGDSRAFGLGVPFDTTVDRLCHRGVLRKDEDTLAFVVPLFQEWLVTRSYDAPEAAVQYNSQTRAGGMT